MFKQEFLEKNEVFCNIKLLVDLGYLGIVADFCGKVLEIEIPQKKPKKSKNNPDPKLTEEQKEENKQKSRIRVKVENSIAGAKRMRIVSHVFRNKTMKFNDLVMAISCSLWNLHLVF